MATIDWPANLRPQTFSPALRKAGLQFRSPFNGTAQAIDFVAERWVFSLALPPRRVADGNPGQVEALFNKLAGGVERVRCHHWYRPVPMGTLRGSPTLASGASRGNTSLAITGAVAAPNALRGSGFEVDSNVDGLSEVLTAYSAGSTGSVSYSRPSGNGSVAAQRIDASALGTGSGDRAGFLWSSLQPLPAHGAASYTLCVDAQGSANLSLFASVDWHAAGGSLVSSSTVSAPVPTTWARVQLPALMAPALATQFYLYFWITRTASAGTSAAVLLDNAQLEPGGLATAYVGLPTLKAGDMLGCGGQLFQVADDVTLNDAGAGTVNVVNRVRATIAGGTAVTWDRPTAEFIVPANFAAASYRPAILEGMPLDLEEVW